MSKNISLEIVDSNRGELYKGYKYTPTPFEQEADLHYMHHSDGGITEILHTTPANEGNPTLLMVPGFITILDSWEVFLQGIKDEFEIYYWESREKGTFHPPSNVNRKHFTDERFVKDLVEVIKAIGLTQGKYIIAGSSFGGTIMIDALAQGRITPKIAILIGANTHFHIPFPGNILVRIVPASLIGIFKPVLRWYLRNFAVDRSTDEKQYQKYVKAIDLANFKYIKHTVLNYHRHPQEAILKNIDAHTLVVGAEKDMMHTVDETGMTADLIPNSEYKVFETNNETHSEPFVKYFKEKFAER